MIYTNVILKPETRDGNHGFYFANCNEELPDIYLPASDEITYDVKHFRRNLSLEVNDGVPKIVTRMDR